MDDTHFLYRMRSFTSKFFVARKKMMTRTTDTGEAVETAESVEDGKNDPTLVF